MIHLLTADSWTFIMTKPIFLMPLSEPNLCATSPTESDRLTGEMTGSHYFAILLHCIRIEAKKDMRIHASCSSRGACAIAESSDMSLQDTQALLVRERKETDLVYLAFHGRGDMRVSDCRTL